MKLEGEMPLPEPAVSKPRPGVPGPATLSRVRAVPIPSSASSAETPMAVESESEPGTSGGGELTQAAMMELLKADLAAAIHEDLNDTVKRLVSRVFGRLTENIANMEAKTAQRTPQLIAALHQWHIRRQKSHGFGTQLRP